MRRFLAVLLVLTMVSAVFVMTGCNSRDEALVGTWAWTIDPGWTITFNADGSGRSWESAFTWRTSGNYIIFSGAHDNGRVGYSISGNTITLRWIDGTHSYTRIN
ncbi:MAG: hypothetical protein LBE35_03745 [Clostridiales bacterium]|jgi:hypothetical protein|nr:hypothetical protein [Clostridiales bacterium]